MHEEPDRMKEFFAMSADITNDFDVKHQNDEAVKLFQKLLEDHRDGRA